MRQSFFTKMLAAAISVAALAAAPTQAARPAPAAASAQADPKTARFDARIAAAKGAMMSEPGAALANARAAIAEAKALSGTQAAIAVTTGHWLEGEALVRLNRIEEARPIIESAIAVAQRVQPNGKLHADLLKSRAGIAGMTGDVQLALSTLHRVHRMYGKLGEARSQAIVFQNIGSIYQEARDFRRVLYYYDLANETFGDDPSLALSSHNNRGNAFKEMGKFAEALKEYQTALNLARQVNSPLLEARILTNVASAQYLMGDLEAADRTALGGLRRATGDAVEWRPFLWGVRAQVAFKRGDLGAATDFIQRTFAGTDLSQTPNLFRDFHETARRIREANGEPALALAHLKAVKRLDDEAHALASSTQSALMSARFDTANQELRISRLKQARLADEVQLARSNQRLRSMTVLGLIGALCALAIIAAVSFGLASARRARRAIAAVNEQLSHSANHDGLTGLPNRGQFRALLSATIENAKADQKGCAVFLVDLDRFKAVNDTMGHQAGDAVLCETSSRLQALVAGKGHAGRLGGDEFAAFVPYANLDEEPVGLADEIVAELSRPIPIDGRTVSIGATVGMAAFPLDGATVDQLTRCADLALYHAKQAGRGRSAKYASFMQIEMDKRRQLESDLRTAIDEGQLDIAYQPIVDAKTTEVVAYEALLRWEHPERGEIPPSEFIPVAEETKLIGEIGQWVLRTACTEAATWPGNVKLAVNLSAIQIEGVDLTANVVHALAANGLTTDRLELEVTESVFLRRGPNTEATLARLQGLGVSLALDDFGTGFSSLSYLQRASFSTIKIDRGFVQSAADGRKESVSIIRAIVEMARGLGMETTAEGVESAEHMELMRSLGCTRFQGFFFGRPLVSTRTGAAPENEAEPAANLVRRRRAIRRAG